MRGLDPRQWGIRVAKGLDSERRILLDRRLALVMDSIGEYEVRRLTEGGISDVVWLLRASYPDERYSLAQRVAKFDTGYTGVKNVGYLAYHGGVPAAFYGLFPCRMRWRGAIVLGAQSGDTVTHPSHRRRGLFYHLAEKTYQLAQELGVSLVFGFPNPHNSYPGLLKLGWQAPFHMQVRVAPISGRLRKLLPRALGRSKFARAEIIAPSELDLNSINSRRGELYVERSNEFLSYKRYSDNLLIRCRSGDAWISIRRDGLFIGDFWPSSDDAAVALWHEVLDEAQALGLPRVHYHTTPNATAHGIAGELGSGLPVCVKILGKHDPDPSTITLSGADYDTF